MYTKIKIKRFKDTCNYYVLYACKNPIHQAYLYLHIHLDDEHSHNIFSSYLLHASEKYISLYFTISINQAIIHVEQRRPIMLIFYHEPIIPITNYDVSYVCKNQNERSKYTCIYYILYVCKNPN